MSEIAFAKIHDGLVDAYDMVALEARAISAETKIAEARAILEAATADDGAMLSPVMLSDAVMKAIAALA